MTRLAEWRFCPRGGAAIEVEGLRRELREETGLELEIGAFVDSAVEPYDRRRVLTHHAALVERWRRGLLDGSPGTAS